MSNSTNGSFSSSLRGFSRSPAFKTFVIGTLIFLLTIPLFAVWGLVQERENNAQSVQREVARSWGEKQTVTGPFLIIPYTVRQIVERKDRRVEQEVTRHAVFLPETLLSLSANTASPHRTFTASGASFFMSGAANFPESASLARYTVTS